MAKTRASASKTNAPMKIRAKSNEAVKAKGVAKESIKSAGSPSSRLVGLLLSLRAGIELSQFNSLLVSVNMGDEERHLFCESQHKTFAKQKTKAMATTRAVKAQARASVKDSAKARVKAPAKVASRSMVKEKVKPKSQVDWANAKAVVIFKATHRSDLQECRSPGEDDVSTSEDRVVYNSRREANASVMM